MNTQLCLDVTSTIYDIIFQFLLLLASGAADYSWIVVYPLCIGREIKPITQAFLQFNLPPVYKQTYKQNPGIQAQITFLRRQHRSAVTSTFQPHPDHHRYRDITLKIERLTTGMQVYHSN